jgi:hypothetical protein
MGFSIYHDWRENNEDWTNHGMDILRASCKHKDGVEKNDYCEKCDIHEDSCEPMMNYIYPLECTNFEDKEILKVVKETNCTIMENKEGEFFLTLCGGGMDLSQDIAFAYFILENWIPEDLIREVAKQPCLSLGKKNYKILARAIIKQLKDYSIRNREKAKEWKESLKLLKEKN